MPSMTEITKGVTPQKLLSGVQPEEKRADMTKILAILKKHSKEIHVYGGSIIGAGKMLYQSKSQKPYTWFQCGMAARASNITMYFGCIFKLSNQASFFSLTFHSSCACCCLLLLAAAAGVGGRGHGVGVGVMGGGVLIGGGGCNCRRYTDAVCVVIVIVRCRGRGRGLACLRCGRARCDSVCLLLL
ncbi:unnamed protein product [Symbiodinium pilosum]|uniref:Uncharacterized protein n=1 Tax=Symbiodinium pilosum TaxID=2952 RepID=A0A812VLR8_SYMPI|nr:unnamed protein product [Symbiodinium pilosum]